MSERFKAKQSVYKRKIPMPAKINFAGKKYMSEGSFKAKFDTYQAYTLSESGRKRIQDAHGWV